VRGEVGGEEGDSALILSTIFTFRVVRYILFRSDWTRHHKVDRRGGRGALLEVVREGDIRMILSLLFGLVVLARLDTMEGVREISTIVSSSESALSRCLPFRVDNDEAGSVKVEDVTD
jgi:hypothetical protein